MSNHFYIPAKPMINILKQWAYCNKLHWRNEEKYIDYIFELYTKVAITLN